MLDRNSPLPLYYQVKLYLLREIAGGGIRNGEQLPSEYTLAKRFGVSRLTVRETLRQLRHEGVLDAHRGRGTFVRMPHITVNFAQFSPFVEEVKRVGLVPGGKVVEQRVVRLPRAIASRLMIPSYTKVARITRTREASDVRLGVYTSYIPLTLCPGILEKDLDNISLDQVLIEDYGILVTRSVEVVQAVIIPPGEATLLSVPSGSPGLLREALLFSADDRPVQFSRAIYRGDLYKIHCVLRRSHAVGASTSPRTPTRIRKGSGP